MEELCGEGESEGGGSRTGSRRSPFRNCLPTSSTDFGIADAAAVLAPSYSYYHPYPSASPSSFRLQARPPPELSQGDAEEIKAKIMSHPKYSDLLAAFVDCQKVGAPPEVAARLSATARQLALDPAAGRCSHTPHPPDPELDQFMELYCDVLIKFREELARPLQEAEDFLNEIASQLNLLPSDLLLSGVGSSSKDEDGDSGGEADPRDKELKQHLLKKYGSYLSDLRQGLSKKKKKGNLPKDARRKLLNWWELHYKWPYPSEMEKAALADSTGLNQKQINNWFINQRKRYWKPSEDKPQLFVTDGYHPQTAGGGGGGGGLFSIDGQSVCVDGMYRFG